jgi:hypothetical protein
MLVALNDCIWALTAYEMPPWLGTPTEMIGYGVGSSFRRVGSLVGWVGGDKRVC